MKLVNGDSMLELTQLEENSIDSVVCDPPYELGFMNKKWDNTGIANNVGLWEEVLRALKPGGHMLTFGGTRTHHRMMVAIEDAGFQIRDCLMWVYGVGFPKSHNIGKSLPDWEGWGTALKPAWEPIILARKPLSEKTIVKNVLKHGTGGINIDKSRIPLKGGEDISIDRNEKLLDTQEQGWGFKSVSRGNEGRFPANIMFDEEAGKLLDEQSGIIKTGSWCRQKDKMHAFGDAVGSEYNEWKKIKKLPAGASRYFYCPKSSKKERQKYCEGLEDKTLNRVNPGGLEKDPRWAPVKTKNNHPTLKPIKLLKYLIGLITPEGGTVLDPFMGSGSTGLAAIEDGYDFIGIELEKDYFNIASTRINNCLKNN